MRAWCPRVKNGRPPLHYIAPLALCLQYRSSAAAPARFHPSVVVISRHRLSVSGEARLPRAALIDRRASRWTGFAPRRRSLRGGRSNRRDIERGPGVGRVNLEQLHTLPRRLCSAHRGCHRRRWSWHDAKVQVAP
ncbi:hypothetical protein MRX96_013669 [Rhipicephalus microplus]